MFLPHASSHKKGQPCCPFALAYGSCKNYILQCSTVIGVAVLLPFLGVSSLNFGPLARVAFFLGYPGLLNHEGDPQVNLCATAIARPAGKSRQPKHKNSPCLSDTRQRLTNNRVDLYRGVITYSCPLKSLPIKPARLRGS